MPTEAKFYFDKDGRVGFSLGHEDDEYPISLSLFSDDGETDVQIRTTPEVLAELADVVRTLESASFECPDVYDQEAEPSFCKCGHLLASHTPEHPYDDECVVEGCDCHAYRPAALA